MKKSILTLALVAAMAAPLAVLANDPAMCTASNCYPDQVQLAGKGYTLDGTGSHVVTINFSKAAPAGVSFSNCYLAVPAKSSVLTYQIKTALEPIVVRGTVAPGQVKQLTGIAFHNGDLISLSQMNPATSITPDRHHITFGGCNLNVSAK